MTVVQVTDLVSHTGDEQEMLNKKNTVGTWKKNPK